LINLLEKHRMNKDELRVDFSGVPDELRDIVPKFLENQRNDIDEVLRAIENKDFQTIARIGHAMKGYSRPYGFLFLEKMGKDLERAAKEKDKQGVLECCQSIFQFLDKLDDKNL
jgi:HPt (histidine-containing phosphotransfer) domain-containing protein